MNRFVCVLMGVVLVVGLLTAGSVQAEFIQPTGATASSFLGSAYSSSDYGPGYARDGSGLSAETSTATHGSGSGATTMWLSLGTAGEWISFDLGAERSLTQAYVWNYNQHEGTDLETIRGIQHADIYVANSSGVFTTPLYSNVQLTMADGTGTTPSQTISLVADHVQYVKFQVVDTWGGAPAGLSEVRFEGVPEPSMIVLLGAGLLSLLAYAWRKRR